MFNSIQNFVTTSLTRRIYSKSPASGEHNCPIDSLLASAAGPLSAVQSLMLAHFDRRSDPPAGAHVRGLDAHVCGRANLRGLQHSLERVGISLWSPAGSKPMRDADSLSV